MSRTRKKRGGSAPSGKKMSSKKRSLLESMSYEENAKKQDDVNVKNDVFKKIMRMMPFPANLFVNPISAMAVKGLSNFKLIRKIMHSYVLTKNKFGKQYGIIIQDPKLRKEFDYACKLIKRYYDPNIGKQFQVLRTSKEIHRSCTEYRVLDKQFSLLRSARETNQHNNDTDILYVLGYGNNSSNKFESLYSELKNKYSSLTGGMGMDIAKLAGPVGNMVGVASSILSNTKNNTTSGKLTKEQEDENHAKIEGLFLFNKKNCSYIIPRIMIDILTGSEFIYRESEKSEDPDYIENIKYIGIEEDCDTAYTLSDALELSGLTKPVESAMGVEPGKVNEKIKQLIHETKKSNLIGGYSKRFVPKKRRLTRRRVNVTK